MAVSGGNSSQIRPRRIDERELPPTRGQELWRAYRNGVRSHFFGKQLKKHSVSRKCSDVKELYGGRNIMTIADRKGKPFHFLTEGIPKHVVKMFIDSTPKGWSINSNNLGILDWHQEKLRFVVLPRVNRYVKLSKPEREGIPAPDTKISAQRYELERYRRIFPLNDLERQALVRELSKLKNYRIEGKDDARTTWEFNDGSMGIFCWRPEVKMPEMEKGRMDFRRIDLLLHPFRSMRAFFRGIGEALSKYAELRGLKS